MTVGQKGQIVEEYEVVVPNISWLPLLQSYFVVVVVMKDSIHAFPFDLLMRSYILIAKKKKKNKLLFPQKCQVGNLMTNL